MEQKTEKIARGNHFTKAEEARIIPCLKSGLQAGQLRTRAEFQRVLKILLFLFVLERDSGVNLDPISPTITQLDVEKRMKEKYHLTEKRYDGEAFQRLFEEQNLKIDRNFTKRILNKWKLVQFF